MEITTNKDKEMGITTRTPNTPMLRGIISYYLLLTSTASLKEANLREKKTDNIIKNETYTANSQEQEAATKALTVITNILLSLIINRKQKNLRIKNFRNRNSYGVSLQKNKY